MIRLLFFLFSLFYSVFAFDLKGRIVWNEICPSISDLGQAKVILDDGKAHYGGVTRSGQFVIPHVSPGTYVLSVVAHDHAFERFRIDIFETDTLPEVRPHVIGTPLSPPSAATLPYPITLHPRLKYNYYVPRESFNILGMFQNPMMMLMVLTGGLMLGMPYLMKNMDPEVLNEFKDRQAQVNNIQSAIQSGDIKGGLSAMLQDGSKTPPSSSASKGQSSAVRSRGKAKRR